MAESTEDYGFTITICIECASFVIVAAPRIKRSGAVNLRCPTVGIEFIPCGAKMVPIESTDVTAEVLGVLINSLETNHRTSPEGGKR